MGSGCGDSIVEKFLRPPGKLPVPVALNALSPTLFMVHYTYFAGNVKRKCKNMEPAVTVKLQFAGMPRLPFRGAGTAKP